MARAGHNDRCSSGPDAVPPFYLCAGERRIDQRVLAVARDCWSWAFWLIKKQLNDGPRTAEIVENVAADVASRLRADPEVGRNLNGYFRTAVILRVKTLALRDGRLTYAGCAQDLEANHRPCAPDWTKVIEDRLALQSLLPFMSHPVRCILHYRQLDYSWKQVGQRLALTEKQAKLRFYYGVRQAHEELLVDQARRRARGEESEPWK
jgi:hypothetical protein